MPCCSVDDLVDARERERVLWTGLVKVFKIDAEALGFVLFGTITRLASQSGCFISLMNPASKSLASSSPIACLLGSENSRRACLTGLNPFRIFRLCSAACVGFLACLKGARQKCPNFPEGILVVRLLHQDLIVPQWMPSLWGPLDGPEI